MSNKRPCPWYFPPESNAESSPPVQPTPAAVLDPDAHQFGVDYSRLSDNAKRHARAMLAALVRLEAGAA